MGHFSTSLARVVRKQHGIVNGDQLRDDGLSPELIERLRSRRLLMRTHADIYRVATADDTFESRCVTACLAAEHVAVAGAAAAALWDFDHVYIPTHPECLLLGDTQGMVPVRGVTYRRSRLLRDADTFRRSDGILLLTRAWTWLDCVAELPPERASAFTHHVLDSQCDVHELWDVVDRFESRRRGPRGRAHIALTAQGERRRSNSATAA